MSTSWQLLTRTRLRNTFMDVCEAPKREALAKAPERP